MSLCKRAIPRLNEKISYQINTLLRFNILTSGCKRATPRLNKKISYQINTLLHFNVLTSVCKRAMPRLNTKIAYCFCFAYKKVPNIMYNIWHF